MSKVKSTKNKDSNVSNSSSLDVQNIIDIVKKGMKNNVNTSFSAYEISKRTSLNLAFFQEKNKKMNLNSLFQ